MKCESFVVGLEHTQTLSHKTHRLRDDGFIVGFAKRAQSSKYATTLTGGGHLDQERISALQSAELRHQRKDCYCPQWQPQQVQHQLSHRVDSEVSPQNACRENCSCIEDHYSVAVRTYGTGDAGARSDARPHTPIRGCNAHAQAIPDCETAQGIHFSRVEENDVGSATAWLGQGLEELQSALGARLLLRQRRTRKPRRSEALHLGTAAQTERVRVLDIRRFDRHDQDRRLHTEEANGLYLTDIKSSFQVRLPLSLASFSYSASSNGILTVFILTNKVTMFINVSFRGQNESIIYLLTNYVSMANNQFTEDDMAKELMAVELIADAAKQGVRLTLAQARSYVWVGYLALSDVLEARGALSEKAKELRNEVLA